MLLVHPRCWCIQACGQYCKLRISPVIARAPQMQAYRTFLVSTVRYPDNALAP